MKRLLHGRDATTTFTAVSQSVLVFAASRHTEDTYNVHTSGPLERPPDVTHNRSGPPLKDVLKRASRGGWNGALRM